MSELFAQAAELMLAGMGVVFVFLIVLTGAVALLTKLCPEHPPAASAPTTSSTSPSADDGSQAKKLAAIAVAVQRYRQAKAPESNHKE